jgi:hypothetical protein
MTGRPGCAGGGAWRYGCRREPSREASRQALPGRALELIGHPPVVADGFDVEATVEGRYETRQLALLGPAFDGTVEETRA